MGFRFLAKQATAVLLVAVIMLVILSCRTSVVVAMAQPHQTPQAPTGLRTMLMDRSAYSIAPEDVNFSWIVNDSGINAYQTAYQIQLSTTRANLIAGQHLVYDTEWITSQQSTAVRIANLALENNTLYLWRVRTRNHAGLESEWSEPKVFTTLVDWVDERSVWLEDNGNDHELRNFVFVRHKFEIHDINAIERVVLSAAAHNTENSKQHVFDLYMNNRMVGMGPARISWTAPQPHALYNCFDVTGFLNEGSNLVGAILHDKGHGRGRSGREGFTGNPRQMFMLQMTVYRTDGTIEVITNTARDASAWMAMDGTRAFGDRGSGGAEDIHREDWYDIRREHLNANYFPFGWEGIDFEMDERWRPVSHRRIDVEGSPDYYLMTDRRPRGLRPYHGGNMLRFPIHEYGHRMNYTWTDYQGFTGEAGRVVTINNEQTVISYEIDGRTVYIVDLAHNIVGGLEIYLGDLLMGLPLGDVVLDIRLGEYKPWYRTQIGHFPDNHTGTDLRGPYNPDGWVRYNGWGHPPYRFDWTFMGGQYNPPLRNFNMMNFRWVEIHGMPEGVSIEPHHVTGWAFRQDFDHDAHHFYSSDHWLNTLYEFACYAIKATTQDLWTDTQSRERRAYEGDALVNMLMNNVFQAQYLLGRHTHEHMLFRYTWPMEYRLYSVEMAWLDYLFTGCTVSIEEHYHILRQKLATNGPFSDGRRTWNEERGLYYIHPQYLPGHVQALLIDWPIGERDNHHRLGGFVTAYNAVSVGAHRAMAHIAKRLGFYDDMLHHQMRADIIVNSLIRYLFDYEAGTFRDSMTSDGERSTHTAQHTVVHALTYGVFDSPEMAAQLGQWVLDSGGIRTSIFSSYFVLAGLYNAGRGDVAMQFMLEPNGVDQRRSWRHVLTYLRATISPESWCYSLKWNCTMSHPWGATPAIGIAMGMFGIRPTAGAFAEFDIRLQPGGIAWAEITYPTIRGSIDVSFENGNVSNEMVARVNIPANTVAQVSLPVDDRGITQLYVDGERIPATRNGQFLTVELGSGARVVSVQYVKILPEPVETGDPPANGYDCI